MLMNLINSRKKRNTTFKQIGYINSVEESSESIESKIIEKKHPKGEACGEISLSPPVEYFY